MTLFGLAEVPSLNRHSWNCHSKPWWCEAKVDNVTRGNFQVQVYSVESLIWIGASVPGTGVKTGGVLGIG